MPLSKGEVQDSWESVTEETSPECILAMVVVTMGFEYVRWGSQVEELDHYDLSQYTNPDELAALQEELNNKVSDEIQILTFRDKGGQLWTLEMDERDGVTWAYHGPWDYGSHEEDMLWYTNNQHPETILEAFCLFAYDYREGRIPSNG